MALTLVGCLRVRVRNAVGKAVNGQVGIECFQIAITGSGAGSVGDIVEECEIRDFQGGNTTAINMGIGSGLDVTGIVRNNRIILPKWELGAAFGINFSWVRNHLIEGNYVEGGDAGIYSDWGSATNLTIVNNFIRNSRYGIRLYAIADGNPPNPREPKDNITIAHNTIEVTNAYGATGIWFNDNSADSFRSIKIFGNSIRVQYNQTPSTVNGIILQYCTGVLMHHNFVQLGLTFDVSTSIGYNIFDNFDMDGNLTAWVHQVAPANSIIRRTITSSTTALPTDKYIGVQTSATVGVQLPSATGIAGKEYIIVGEHSSPNIYVSPAGGGQTINTVNGSFDNTQPVYIGTAYGVLRLISDGGSKWHAW
jgi:hypothetical protein